MVEPPLPFGNAVARWYYVLLKGLVQRGHEVTAFATCKNQADAQAAQDLFSAPGYSLRCYQHAKLNYLASKAAALKRPHTYLFSPELKRDIASKLNSRFDIFHLEALWSGWLALAHRKQTLLNLHYLFQIDRADERFGSMLEWARAVRTNQAETYLLRQYPFICTVTSRLTARVRKLSPSAEVHTIPFGFDSSHYAFQVSPNGGLVVGLIGSFDWLPSYSAGKRLLENLWPEIYKRVPCATLHVVGRRALAVFSEYANRPGITIHQDVPDTLPYFRRINVLLYAPVRGSGIKVKVLEAFALGVPVVTTEDGIEGIPAVDGVHARICDSNKALIDQTVALLGDPEARRRQSAAARALVEEHFHPDVALDAIERVYRRIIAHRQN